VDVSATGTGSPILDSPARLGGTSTQVAAAVGTTPGIPDDTVGPLLQLLSNPAIRHFLDSFDARRFPQDAAALDGLLQTAGSAAAHNDAPRALAALTEYINRNPEHASTLLASPLLTPIQSDVRELLRQATQDAKTAAVRLISMAGEVVEGAVKHPERLDGPGALAIAERLVESGQLVNYFRAADLSEAVIAFYARAVPDLALDTARGAERGKLNSKQGGRHAVLRLVKIWWATVPLLVLLVGWVALGAAGGAIVQLARAAGVELLSASTVRAAFELWGVGFLALVVFQFWITVRGIR